MKTESFSAPDADAITTRITDGANVLVDTLPAIELLLNPRNYAAEWIARRKLILAAARYGNGL